MTSPVRSCLVVDDSPTFCASVRGMLETGGLAVVATASTLAEAVDATTTHDPDLVLVDIDLGGESGFDVVEVLHGLRPRHAPAILLVSTHDQDDFAEMVEASSAIGFLQKIDLSTELILRTVSGTSPRT